MDVRVLLAAAIVLLARQPVLAQTSTTTAVAPNAASATGGEPSPSASAPAASTPSAAGPATASPPASLASPPTGRSLSPAAPSASPAGGGAAGGAVPSSGGILPARPAIARVSAGAGTLPNTHGQVWREYDISPYTLRIQTTNRPEQAIVDWVLRETGYEAWHSEPLGILSATPRVLRVYHTPQVQAVVAEVVDRFVNPEAETHGFSLRVITLDSPNWRARVHRMLAPVPVQTPGVQAWLLEKEGAAMFLAELRRRSDFREHNSSHLLVTSGQSMAVTAPRGRSYVRNIILRPEVWPGYEPESGLIDEGFALEFSPLLSVDGRMIDAMVKCDIDQVEKFQPVMLDVPTMAAPRQRTKIEVPQMSQFRFHERFRWPVEQVLLIGMGVVPSPVLGEPKALVPGVPLPLAATPPRADMLVLIESKGKTAGPRTPPPIQAGIDPRRR